MSMSQKQYQAYAAAMQTMSGTRQIVMLYDGVLRCLNQAREAMQQRKIEVRYNNLKRAAEIVFGLQSCLNFESGAEVAKVLYGFYASIDARIFSLHRSNDVAACDELVTDLRRMRDVWASIDSGAPAVPPAEAAASQPAAASDVLRSRDALRSRFTRTGNGRGIGRRHFRLKSLIFLPGSFFLVPGLCLPGRAWQGSAKAGMAFASYSVR